jgi:hypothetical protein
VTAETSYGLGASGDGVGEGAVTAAFGYSVGASGAGVGEGAASTLPIPLPPDQETPPEPLPGAVPPTPSPIPVTPPPPLKPVPVCDDPASEVINAVMNAMRAVFSPTAACPPIGGGSTVVRFFAGEGAPISDVLCDSPYLWVRLAARFRSNIFPEPAMNLNPCGSTEVITVEIGVARCALMDESPTDAQYAREAEISLDDSWRLGKVMCLTMGLLKNERQIGGDMIIPVGPEGGIIAWTSSIYISI